MRFARFFLVAALSTACGTSVKPTETETDTAPPTPALEPAPATDNSPSSTKPPPQKETPPGVPEEQRPFVLPAVQQSVQAYELVMPPEVLAKFYADKDTDEQDATFRCAGVDYPVKVRLRGASARDFPKKSWNVSFNKTSPFEGRTSLNLVAEYSDATLLAEKISFDLLAAMRVPASSAKFVRLSVNGHTEGVFLDIEQVNKDFLQAHAFADKDASIYRAGWKDTELKLRTWKVPYQGDWQKKTNEKTEDHSALDEVLTVISRTPETQFPDALAHAVDLESYLRSMVLDALMANNYIEDSESYFVHDHKAQRWVYVPWDLNNVDARWWYQMQQGPDLVPIYRQPLYTFTLGSGEVARRYRERKTLHPGYLPVFSNLASRVMMNPTLRARLEARLDKALRELFTLEVMDPYINRLQARIAPYISEDPYMDHAKFDVGSTFIHDFIRLRRGFILQERARLQASKASVVLEAVDARSGWVELRNRGTTAVDVGGWVLTTNLRRALPELLQPAPTDTPAEQSLAGQPVGTALAARSLAPDERVRLSAAELGLSFMTSGEVGLFDGQNVMGVKDALFYGALPDGEHYERAADGSWQVR